MASPSAVIRLSLAARSLIRKNNLAQRYVESRSKPEHSRIHDASRRRTLRAAPAGDFQEHRPLVCAADAVPVACGNTSRVVDFPANMGGPASQVHIHVW